jgi:hypothetical protein
VIDFEKINKPKKIQELGDHQVLEAMAKPQRT